MERITTRVTPWQTVDVRGNGREREFRVTGAIHAWWHRKRFLSGLAWDNMAAGVLSHPATPATVLMLGLGGGTTLRILRHLLPDVSLTAVEIDPEMIALAREFMDLDAIGVEVITGDAYAWLRSNRRRFDVIFDDVYGVSAEDVERPAFAWDGMLRIIRRSLQPDGIFGVNLVTGEGHRKVQSAFRGFFRSSFEVVRSVTTEASLNETIVAGGQLRPWRDVRGLALEAFPTGPDRRLWLRLRARKLSRPRRDGKAQ